MISGWHGDLWVSYTHQITVLSVKGREPFFKSSTAGKRDMCSALWRAAAVWQPEDIRRCMSNAHDRSEAIGLQRMCAQLSMWCMWTSMLYTWLVVIKPNGSKKHLISMTTLLWGQLWDERSPKKDGCKGRITETKNKGHNNEMRTIQRGRCEPQGHSLHEVWIFLKVKHSERPYRLKLYN